MRPRATQTDRKLLLRVPERSGSDRGSGTGCEGV